MKRIAIASAMALMAPVFSVALAKAQTPPKKNDLEPHIKRHESLAKAHTDFAKCLKDGKDIGECRAAFWKARRETMKANCECGPRGWGPPYRGPMRRRWGRGF